MSSSTSATVPPSSEVDVDAALTSLIPIFDKAGQGHVFTFFKAGQLTLEQKQKLLKDAKLIEEHVGVDSLKPMLDLALKHEKGSDAVVSLAPFTDVTDTAVLPASTLESYRVTGLSMIAEGKAAICLMAGGQGTRLGSAAPKGCYDIGNLSHKSIFQYQAEKIRSLQRIAAQHAGKDVSSVTIPFYVMTSVVTYTETVAYFKAHSYFGLSSASVFFFNQAELPALTTDGRILLDSKYSINLGPNGNGGIYEALDRSGSLKDMEARGVEFVHVVGVDNVLVKLADPTFIGFVKTTGADCANKVVLKTDPKEKIGVMAIRDGKPAVVEYSEIPESVSASRSSNGALLYSGGNIANHLFSVSFLKRIAAAASSLPFHIARKALAQADIVTGEVSKPKEPNAIKLEMFVFDVFYLAQRCVAFAVSRQSEFSPVKNAPAIGVADSPATALHDMTQYHRRLAERAGATIIQPDSSSSSSSSSSSPFPDSSTLFEISPLLSYDGEGLEDRVKGKTLTTPLHLE